LLWVWVKGVFAVKVEVDGILSVCAGG